jgi:hypothetical protein
MDTFKSYLYKKEFKPSEYREFQRDTNMQGYYELEKTDHGIFVACWVVDEQNAKTLGWLPCMRSDIKRYKDLYEPKPLNELDEIAIKSASKAGFDRIRENLKF